MEEMSKLRKYTSLRYYGQKLYELFHKQKRDTIICEEEEDDDDEYYRQSKNDIVRCEELTVNDWEKMSNASSHASLTTAMSSSAYSASSELLPQEGKEQRWCVNCSKCFQRRLSHYELYCGLDCKTAHRVRQSL
ncbi:TPA: hypothetical protein N0F65_007842 [Lagenidium giganteum]|uniref:Uncharacterized protein n=1 Tax=Lagenidium giganteum TaxID=4803 RepID=A0AAV2Z0P6_9STRA|nr:TPA: hypothetical protein N0F65_007842 [Lagenidium giganteum]